MQLYRSSGHAYLVCPRLLELDLRHGEHRSRPHCAARHGASCPIQHDHETFLNDPEGHTVNDFYWLPGCRPPLPDEHPVCRCGLALALADLDDLYAPEHLEEVD